MLISQETEERGTKRQQTMGNSSRGGALTAKTIRNNHKHADGQYTATSFSKPNSVVPLGQVSPTYG